MKQLICEICEGNNLVKEDGMYVCKDCGAKYSVEEAKKMMVEGKVDVSGSTVKIDQSEELDNYYEIAKNAYNSLDYERAATYYDKIVEKKPKDWEANFYSLVSRSRLGTIGEIGSQADKYTLRLPQIEKLVLENEKDPVKRREILQRITDESILNLKSMQEVYINTVDEQTLGVANRMFEGLSMATAQICRVLGFFAEIVKIDGEKGELGEGDEYKQIIITLLKARVDIALNKGTKNAKVVCIKADQINKWIGEVRAYEPDYKQGFQQSDGCYVATAVYGSYDCPQVWTLRRYRDNELAETWYGRAFIKTYYAISPTLVRWFGETTWFKKMWRGKLDRMVKRLQDEGFESTPYEDKKW